MPYVLPEIIEHIVNIATGASAGIGLVFVLHVLGVSVTPVKRAQEIRYTPHAAVVGAAIAVLTCWYGIKFKISLQASMTLLVMATAVLLFVRRKNLTGPNRPGSPGRTLALRFVSLYAFFYAIAYAFAMPAASSDFLPITRIGNNDILSYIVTASYLLRLGTSNISGFSFIDAQSMIATFTPAVLDTLAGVATLFNGETLRAAMPTIFGVLALIGCSIVWIARSAFLLPTPAAVGIASVLLSGPFLRYIIGNYFLSSLVATVFLLLLLAKTIEIAISQAPKNSRALIYCFAPYYFLIFYSYPPLFIIGCGLQIGFIVIFYALSTRASPLNPRSCVELLPAFARSIGIGVASIATVWAMDPSHFERILDRLRYISGTGVGGWALDFISPFALLGLPVAVQLHTFAVQVVAIAGFTSVAFAICYCYVFRSGSKTPAAGGALLILAICAFLAYFAYYFHVGSSYQQWKLASYLPLFIAFTFASAVSSFALSRVNEGLGARLTTVVIVLFCALSAIGNMALHIFKENPVEQFPAKYERLRVLDALGDSKELYIKMGSFSSTFFPVYYIQNKSLHLVSPSYFPQEELKVETVSPNRPLFVEGGQCEAGDGNVSILGVGCLYFEPPSMRIDRLYPFNESLPGLVGAAGLSGQEQWGKWTDSKVVKLKVMLSRQAMPGGEVRYINFQVTPFVLNTVPKQDVIANWGLNRSARRSIVKPEWISLPYTKNDLSGFELRQITITLELPDAISPHEVDAANPDGRKLAIGFSAVSVSKLPLGPIMGP